MKISNHLLFIAGLLNFGFAVGQAAISIVPAWAAAFGASNTLASNPTLLLVAGLLVTLLFGIAGLYGLSGAGVIRRLPLLRLGLFVIGALYTLNGIVFVPQLLSVLGILPSPQVIQVLPMLASAAFLLVGLLYLGGLASAWKSLKIRNFSPSAVINY